jgi:hypothetical protein
MGLLMITEKLLNHGIKDELQSAKVYMEDRSIRIEIKDDKKLSDIKKLIDKTSILKT